MRFTSLALQFLIASSSFSNTKKELLLQATGAVQRTLVVETNTISCISTKEDLKNAIANAVDDDIIPLCSDTTYELNKDDDPESMTLTANGVELTCINENDGSLSNSCVIDGGSANGRKQQILDVQADSFVISGITFQNAKSKIPGAAINISGTNSISGGSHYTITNCTFKDNKVTKKGGAAVEIQICEGCDQTGTSLTIQDCTFDGNESKDENLDYAGALSVENVEDIFIKGCTFMQNKSARDGGAANFELINHLEIENCIFNMNEAGQWGGAINIEDTTNAIISLSTFTGNKDLCSDCEEGGSAVGAESVGNLEIRDSSFVGNDSMGWGAVCSINVQTLNVKDTVFESNTAEGGGGIYAEMGTSLTLTDCEVTTNVARSDCGGGIETDTVDSSHFSNLCFAKNEAPDGGAGCSWDDKEDVTFENVMTNDNGGNMATDRKGCDDFSFDRKCITFLSGTTCSVF